MELHVLVFVLAITQTSVLARPSRKQRSVADNSIEGIRPTTEGLTLRLPTSLQHELKIYIKGTLDTKSDQLEIVFPSHNRQEEEYCRFIYNFKDEAIYFSEDSLELFEGKQPYSLFTAKEKPKDYPPFTLELKGNISEDNINALHLTLNMNDAEEVPRTCLLTTFEEFERIEFRTGLHSITSLLMQF